MDLFADTARDVDAFHPEEIVVAVDETTTTRLGAARIRDHDAAGVYEVAELVVVPPAQGQGVGAHLIERALTRITDAGGSRVYVRTTQPEYFTQFGFRGVEQAAVPDCLPMADEEAIVLTLEPTTFRMPDRLRQRFKRLRVENEAAMAETTAEEFDETLENASYKYEL